MPDKGHLHLELPLSAREGAWGEGNERQETITMLIGYDSQSHPVCTSQSETAT